MQINKKEIITKGQAVLGIELGSTRIKSVLIDKEGGIIASGSYEWENNYLDGIWTYDLDQVWLGIQASYSNLVQEVDQEYKVTLKKVASIGISAMMHGYLTFNKREELLVPFRTWRNTITNEACKELSKELQFNIPQRWSIAHLYQAIMNQEEHVSNVDFLTTLSGYVHWKLTGNKVLGIGDASGMFPIDSVTKDYQEPMVVKCNQLMKEKGINYKVRDVFPKVLPAGEEAGILTNEGAKLLDVGGSLEPGIPLCPPEGDAGTGMVATNSVAVRTGNVSAGTSVFAMVVLEHALSKSYEEVDMVTTPTGEQVAMIHCNNCTSDLNAWVQLFEEVVILFGTNIDRNELFTKLYHKALEGDEDCGGLLSYNYFSGEHITGFEEGRPLFVRTPESKFNLANFMRVNLCTSLGALKTGLDLLMQEEKVKVDVMLGHGGFFKTAAVTQKIMAAAIDAPVCVMKTAGEGGSWGIALLAAYMVYGESGEQLDRYLERVIFAKEESHSVEPDSSDVEGFNRFMKLYKEGLAIERTAVEVMKN